MFDDRTEQCVLAIEQIVIGYKKKGVGNTLRKTVTVPNVTWNQALYLYFYFKSIIRLQFIIEGQPFTISVYITGQGRDKPPKITATATNLYEYNKFRNDLYDVDEAREKSTQPLYTPDVESIRSIVGIDKEIKDFKRKREAEKIKRNPWLYGADKSAPSTWEDFQEKKPEKGYFDWDEAELSKKKTASPKEVLSDCNCGACRRARGEITDDDDQITVEDVATPTATSKPDAFLANPSVEITVPRNSFEDEARTRPKKDQTYDEWRAKNPIPTRGTMTGRISNAKHVPFSRYMTDKYQQFKVGYSVGVDKQKEAKQEEPKQVQEPFELSDKEYKLVDMYAKRILGNKAGITTLTKDEFEILVKELKKMPPNMKANLTEELGEIKKEKSGNLEWGLL